MVARAAEFDWCHPEWAQQDGSKPEAWHRQHRAGIDELVDAGVVRVGY